MSTRPLFLVLFAALVLTASCAPADDAATESAPATDAAMADSSSDDSMSGTWSGDWGPTPEHRNPVTLELSWDGTSLSGTVNPGPDATPLDSAMFDPATGNIRMEASATDFRGEHHFMIDGRLEGNTMSGSWMHDGAEGDFAITKD